MRVSRQPLISAAAVAAAAALLFTVCHGAATPTHAAQPPSMPTFGSASAYVDPTKPLQNLTVAAIESGQATATGTPLAVQQAFLKKCGRQCNDAWASDGEFGPRIGNRILHGGASLVILDGYRAFDC